MANIKSQKKRIVTNEKSRQRNRACKSELKTAVRAAREAVAAGDATAAYAKALYACRLLDKAASEAKALRRAEQLKQEAAAAERKAKAAAEAAAAEAEAGEGEEAAE